MKIIETSLADQRTPQTVSVPRGAMAVGFKYLESGGGFIMVSLTSDSQETENKTLLILKANEQFQSSFNYIGSVFDGVELRHLIELL